MNSISRRLIFFFLLFSVQAWAQEEGLERTYTIHADFQDLSKRSFPVTLRVDITSHLKQELGELLFVAYPNRFQSELPHLNDLNYRRIYPNGFSSGGIHWGTIQDGANSLEPVAIEQKGMPSQTLWKIRLVRPIQPGEKRTLEIAYRLEVPEKFGAFGTYESIVSLSGGWYPYLPAYDLANGFHPEQAPPTANWKIALKEKGAAVVSGELHREEIVERSFEKLRQLSLLLAPKLKDEVIAGKAWSIRLVYSKQNLETVRPLRELAIRWLEFVESHSEFMGNPKEITIALAPLRNSLVAVGDGVLYVSDRAFHLNQLLEQYHTVPILRGLFYQTWLPKILDRENSTDAHWVTEAIAWRWTERLMKEQDYANLDARTLTPIRIFSFLPTIDQVIYAPQFAYVDVFYDYIYSEDPVRDDPLTFNQRIPSGRTIYAHLEDEVTPEVASHIIKAYHQEGGTSFRKVAEEVSNRTLKDQFATWAAPRPQVNYVLGKHRVQRDANGYDNEVTIRREAPPGFHEPVELRARTERDERIFLRWDGIGEGNEHTFKFRTATPVIVIEIDPRGRLLETDLADNRDPPLYKFVLSSFLFNYDFNANEPEIFVSTTFRKAYGGKNRYNFSALRYQDVYGADFGYTRLFGRLVDRLRLSHGLGIDLGFRHLSEDFAVSYNPATGVPALVPLSPELTTTSLSAVYFTGNQLSLTNPLQGGGGSLAATWGKTVQGENTNYYLVNQAGSWVFKLHPSHLFAFRETIGFSGPDDIPSRVQYGLGGLGGIRGLPASDDQYQGRNILLFSGEYRHFLSQDLDVNFWLFRLRDIQGALFSDAGNVTDTVQERADQAAFGVTTGTGLIDLFELSSFSTDVGYGIRFHLDYLGVNPGLVRFDVAKSLSAWDEEVRYYFGVTQSF